MREGKKKEENIWMCYGFVLWGSGFEKPMDIGIALDVKS